MTDSEESLECLTLAIIEDVPEAFPTERHSLLNALYIATLIRRLEQSLSLEPRTEFPTFRTIRLRKSCTELSSQGYIRPNPFPWFSSFPQEGWKATVLL
jgi:hypothetical protein